MYELLTIVTQETRVVRKLKEAFDKNKGVYFTYCGKREHWHVKNFLKHRRGSFQENIIVYTITLFKK
ncbi:MAG: hypothetical protein ACTSO3_01285 [Candidatus Heimdallarchaeaceae archaeon]